MKYIVKGDWCMAKKNKLIGDEGLTGRDDRLGDIVIFICRIIAITLVVLGVLAYTV